MSEPLSAAELERMKREHRPIPQPSGEGCWTCEVQGEGEDGEPYVPAPFPCDAAKLLAELERREQEDIVRALCGPSTEEERAR